MLKNVAFILIATVAVLVAAFFGAIRAQALSTFIVDQGGTGRATFSASQLLYGNGTAALSSVATTTLTASSPLSLSNPVVKVGGVNSTLSIDTSGAWSGTAGSLAANGANCSSGSAPLGVDASGAVESCFDVWTEAENTSAAYAAQATTLTIAGTADQITSSAGAQDLSANRTWTLSLPNIVRFPQSFTASYGTTTYASSTAISSGYASSSAAHFGVLNIKNQSDGCLTLSSGQIVGTGATCGTATFAWPFVSTAQGGTTTSATTSVIFGKFGFFASGTSAFDDAMFARATTSSATTTNEYVSGQLRIASLNGVLKGTTGVVSAATAGTDYVAGGTGASTQVAVFTGSGAITGDAGFIYDTSLDKATLTYGTTTAITSTYASSTIHHAFFASTTNATTTNATTTTLAITPLTSALLQTNASGVAAEYAGTTCTNQAVTVLSALGVATCSSINNDYWSGTDLSVANGGTGLSTFGGTNTILYTTAADTLSSEAAFLYDPSANKLTADYASTTGVTATYASTTNFRSYFASSTLGTTTAATSTNFALTSLTVGQIPFATTSGSILGDAGLIFENVLGRLTTTYASTTGWSSSYASSTSGIFGTLQALGVLLVPFGAAPVADDPGELAHDTTDNMIVVDDFVVAKATNRIWSVTVASTSPAFVGAGLMAFPIQADGYTITQIQCYVSGGTSKIIAVEDASANSTEDITCGTTATTDDGSITNATFTAAELGNIDFGATSGTVDYVTISVFGQWTRE